MNYFDKKRPNIGKDELLRTDLTINTELGLVDTLEPRLDDYNINTETNIVKVGE